MKGELINYFKSYIDDERDFMLLVLKISFNNLNQQHWGNGEAKSLYESFFDPKSKKQQSQMQEQ